MKLSVFLVNDRLLRIKYSACRWSARLLIDSYADFLKWASCVSSFCSSFIHWVWCIQELKTAIKAICALLPRADVLGLVNLSHVTLRAPAHGFGPSLMKDQRGERIVGTSWTFDLNRLSCVQQCGRFVDGSHTGHQGLPDVIFWQHQTLSAYQPIKVLLETKYWLLWPCGTEFQRKTSTQSWPLLPNRDQEHSLLHRFISKAFLMHINTTTGSTMITLFLHPGPSLHQL